MAYQMSDMISDIGYNFGELEAEGGILSNLAPHSLHTLGFIHTNLFIVTGFY